MLRERHGALEPASRLQVRDARSLGPASKGMFKGIICSVFALLAFRPLALLPEKEVPELPVFSGSEAYTFSFSASACVFRSGDPRPLAEPGPF